MTPPTLKQLMEKATPGSWLSTSSIRRDYVIVEAEGYPLARMEGALDARLANAQLIARCSPSTMLAVVEALEINASQGCDYSREALNALNGKSP